MAPGLVAWIGNGLVLAGLACAAAGTVVGFGAGWQRSLSGWRYARGLAYGFSACMALATGVMWYALLAHDFSVKYVAQVGSLATPLWIDVVSLWSSLEGSILFWGLILAGYVTATLYRNGERNHETMPFATGVFCLIGTFFGLLLAGPANPFLPIPSPVPLDGPGPNPLLQNHILMVIHPPALYLGYVGMTIPFGMAVAALIRGQLGATQLAPMRLWLMIPWTFLTAGIVLGGWWAYEVLGWGGYWAWDPVENASLLPWLTATAALHALMLPGRRGMMKGWTLSLVVATFLLTLLGTFMTRSGVFNSVHSFSQSEIGPVFLGFIAFSLVGCVILLATRVDRIEGEGAVTGVVSREAAFLVNNLLFTVLTFTVLVGTTFPLITEAVKGTRLSVGEPYFDRMAVPIGVAILFLMGVGPALPWGQPDGAKVRATLAMPAGAALAVTAISAVLGVREPWPLLAMACAGFSMAVTLREGAQPVVSRLRAGAGVGGAGVGGAGGVTLGRALSLAMESSRRRIGGYTVHAGIIMMIAAIALSSAFQEDRQFSLAKGESVEFMGYRIRYAGYETREEPNRTLHIGRFEVGDAIGGADAGAGGRVEVMEPALNAYPRMQSPIGTPAVQNRLTHDLYLSLMDVSAEKAGLHVYRTPGMVWLWTGAGVAILGAALAAWPTRREAAAGALDGAAAAKAAAGGRA